MQEENVQEVITLECDTLGGWLVTNHTRTWITREPLAKMADKVTEAQAQLDAAQANLIAVQAQAEQFNAEIEQAKQVASNTNNTVTDEEILARQ